MSIVLMRDAIVARLAQAMPALHVQAGEGQVSVEEIERMGARPPAAIVSCVGIADSDEQGGDFVVAARWAMAILTDRVGDRSKTASRSDGATAVLEAFVGMLADQQWREIDGNGVEGAVTAAGLADRIRAQAIPSSGLDKRGLAMWTLTWEQDVAVLEAKASTLPDFLVARTKFDLSRNPEGAPSGVVDSTFDTNVRSS